MSIRLNPTAWGQAFPLPAVLVDQHLKLASETPLKVILWVCRHVGEPLDTQTIAAAIGKSVDETADGVAYWVQKGILLTDDTPVAPPVVAETPAAPATAPVKQVQAIIPVRPTSEQIVARTKESQEIYWLFQEAQQKLGRTLGYDGQSTILMMHDSYGLPVEVILMALEYCVSMGKTSNHYIAALAQDWAQKEIDTLEKADALIESLKQSNNLWRKLAQVAGIHAPRPTQKQAQYLKQWTEEYGFGEDMILLAYEEMANRTASFSMAYMHKVLTSWHQKGLKNPTDVENDRNNFIQSKKKASEKQDAKKSTKSPSYDLDAFGDSLKQVPAYKKKQ